MELFRSLGALAEAPADPSAASLGVVAEALELGPLPSPSSRLDLFSFQLFPYASVYLGVEGMMGGEARDRVAGFWRVVNQVPPAEPDHLAVLLAAYAELCERDTEGKDSPWRRLRRTFLWEHLLSWLPVYLAKVPTVTNQAFFIRWAELLDLALRSEVEELGLPPATPAALEGAPGLADPRQEGAENLMASLLAPARAGFILTRTDLRRLASQLGFGLRAGERRFALEKLMSQDPQAVLLALAAYAESEPPLDREWGSIAQAWDQRRRASGVLLRQLASAAGMEATAEEFTPG